MSDRPINDEIHELLRKNPNTDLETAILVLWDDEWEEDENFQPSFVAMRAAEELAALQARVAELEHIPDLQAKVKEFTEVFERQCRIILYDDGSGHLEYAHPDDYVQWCSFETVAEFMQWDAAKVKEACNL